MSEEFIKNEETNQVEGAAARQARILREAKQEADERELADKEASAAQQQMQSAFKASREGVPDHVILMVIAYDTKGGQIQVQGPITNKHMAYGMLGLARDCIEQYNRENIPGVQKF